MRDAQEGFILAKIIELMEDGAEVLPLDPKYSRRTCTFEEIYPCGDPKKDVDDNCNVLTIFYLVFLT